MKNFLIVVASLCGLSLLAAAYPPVGEFIEGQVKQPDGWHVGTKNTPVKVDGVLYIDQRQNSGGGNVGGCDGGPGICFTGKGTLVWDFGALTALGAAYGNQTICEEAITAGTATGCRFGDTVLLGIDQAPVNAFGNVYAYISAADSFKVRACADGITDGGSFNMPDASYTVRCFR